MVFKYLSTIILVLIFGIYHPLYAQNQNDSIKNEEIIDENIENEVPDPSLVDSTNLSPGIANADSFAIPAETLYKIWTSALVNPYDTDLTNKPDTTIINLTGFKLPRNGRITSDFGWRRWSWHYGTDIKLSVGDSVSSAFDGMVRISRRSKSFGNFIVIRHNNGLETVYGHLSKRLVFQNQYVKAGEIIGLGGNTGRSTGPHLHFEVRFLGTPINPHDLIDFDSCCVKSDTLFLAQQNFDYIKEIKKVRVHVVRSGDTLWKISRRCGVSIAQLCKLNHISKTTVLRIGRKIRYT